MSKPKLWYGLEQTHEHGYTFTNITVYLDRNCEAETLLSELIDKCVDNRAGYQSLEIAQRVGRYYEAARDRGYASVVTLLYLPRVYVRWQHYNDVPPGSSPQYCTADISFPRNARELRPSLKLWTMLDNAVNRAAGYDRWHSPEPLMSVLARRHASRIYRVTEPPYWQEWCTVSPGAPLPSDQVAYPLAV
jgi:hypothetical protein